MDLERHFKVVDEIIAQEVDQNQNGEKGVRDVLCFNDHPLLDWATIGTSRTFKKENFFGEFLAPVAFCMPEVFEVCALIHAGEGGGVRTRRGRMRNLGRLNMFTRLF